MKKVLLSGLFACLLASNVPANVSAADFKSDANALKHSMYYKTSDNMKMDDEDDVVTESEPNDTPDQASELSIYEFASGRFSTQNDMDYYEVTYEKGYDQFALTGSPYGDVKLTYSLLDQYGKMIEPDSTQYDGTWITSVYDIPPGKYHVLAKDKNGLASKPTDGYVIMAMFFDNTPPPAPTVRTVDDNDKKVTGVADPGSEVIVMNGEKIVGSTYASRTGGYTVAMRSAQKAGSTLSVTAMDDWGNESTAKKVVVKDVTAPGMPKVNAVDSNDKTVTGTAEANAAITIKVGSKVIATGKANSKGKFIVTIKAQKKGTTLYVAASDKAKHVSKSAKVVVKKA